METSHKIIFSNQAWTIEHAPGATIKFSVYRIGWLSNICLIGNPETNKGFKDLPEYIRTELLKYYYSFCIPKFKN